MSVTSDSVIDALGLEGSKSSTYHFADVTDVGDGWCMVRMNAETETRCADVYGASVGDRAQVVIKQDGSCVAVGRRGGKEGGGGEIGPAEFMRATLGHKTLTKAWEVHTLGSTVASYGSSIIRTANGLAFSKPGRVLVWGSAYLGGYTSGDSIELRIVQQSSAGADKRAIAHDYRPRYGGVDTVQFAPTVLDVSAHDQVKLFAANWTAARGYATSTDGGAVGYLEAVYIWQSQSEQPMVWQWETINVYQSNAYGFVRARINRALRIGILAIDLKTFSGGWFLGNNAYSQNVSSVTASIPSECCPTFEFSGAAGAWTKSTAGTFWLRTDGKVAINLPTNDEYIGSLTWSW